MGRVLPSGESGSYGSSEVIRVLVVEDDSDLRTAIADNLRLEGYEVDTAADGQVALQRLRDLRPHVVLLDLRLPKLNGWEFRLAQRREPQLAEIPVIVLSGDRGPAAEAIDADLYLPKPFDLATLIQAIPAVIRSTRLRAAQEAVVRKERLSALGTLSQGLCHEINNPLTYVLLSLRRLRDQGTASAGGARGQNADALIDAALDGAERIAAVIRSVGVFCDAGGSHMSVLAPKQAVDAAVTVVEAQLTERARVRVHHGGAPFVRAAEGALGQVVVNLLLNAAQAIPEGRRHENEIRVQTFEDVDGRAVIEVSDTGAGIPKAFLHRVLEPFFTTRPTGEGSGLGLAIAHGLVTSLGGTLEISSQVGKGTQVTIKLPPASARNELRSRGVGADRVR